MIPEKDCGWTLLTLKAHFDAILSERDKAITAAFNAVEKATDSRDKAQNLYNEKTNEIRGALADQSEKMMTRAEAEMKFTQLREMVDQLRAASSSSEGRTDQSWKIWGLVLVIAGLLIAVVPLVVLVLRR